MPRKSRDKGARGEREIVAWFRDMGWHEAVRSPGSGAMRYSSSSSLSPWPGDLAKVEPFLVEVKYDERVYAPARGWVGQSFIKATLKKLDQQARTHKVIGGATPIPILCARSNLMPWRVFVPVAFALKELNVDLEGRNYEGEYVELEMREAEELIERYAPE